MSLSTLPTEIQVNILFYLDIRSFLSLSQTNHHFRELRKVPHLLCWESYRHIEKTTRYAYTATSSHPFCCLLLCYACFNLLDFLDRKQHYWISPQSKFFPCARYSAARYCVSCDKARGGTYLTAVLEERNASHCSPRDLIALLVEDYPEEAWRLKQIDRAMEYLLRHGPKPDGNRPLTMADVRQWDGARFLREMKNLIARGSSMLS